MNRISLFISATGVLVATISADVALAKTAGCTIFLEVCNGRADISHEACRMYYDAAIKEGGIWASSAAREAIRRKTGSKAIMRNDSPCLP